MNLTGGGTFVRIDEAESEFQRSAALLANTLPDGVTFPKSMPGEWEESGTFETGFGDMQAALFWQCAWLIRYKDASVSGEHASMATALDELQEWSKLTAVVAHVDAESIHTWNTQFVDTARNGNDALLLEMASGCKIE
jgi:hypothetical protein